MLLNDYHAMYVIGSPILKYLKSNNLNYLGNSFRSNSLMNYINQIEEKIDIKKLKENVFYWMYQGRKRVIFTELKENSLNKYGKFKNINELNFNYKDELCGILKLDIDKKYKILDIVFKVKNESGEIEYIFKSNTNSYEIDGILEEIIFIYSVTVLRIDNSKENFESLKEKIAIPVFITLDIVNNEVYARIPAKSDLYNLEETESIEDTYIAKMVLRKVMNKLELEFKNKSVCSEKIARCIFDIHREITTLPPIITRKADNVKEEIINFVKKIIPNLELGLTKEEIEEYEIENSMIDGIKNVVLKEILKTYGEEDIEIFEKDKYATSIGIRSRGASYATLNYNSKSKIPIQCNPEYMNVENIINEIKKVNKNNILWNRTSNNNTSKINTKLYLDNEGFGVLSFEEYVLEEDICNVLSKIRNIKNRQEVE